MTSSKNTSPALGGLPFPGVHDTPAGIGAEVADGATSQVRDKSYLVIEGSTADVAETDFGCAPGALRRLPTQPVAAKEDVARLEASLRILHRRRCCQRVLGVGLVVLIITGAAVGAVLASRRGSGGQADGSDDGGSPVTCAPLSPPIHGRISGGCSGTYGDVCTSTCNPGHVLSSVGDAVRTCGQDGAYSGVAKACSASCYLLSASITQSIPTRAARHWVAFEIAGTPHLAIANYFDPARACYTVDSVVYRWDGIGFAWLQNIQTVGALDVEYFAIHDTPHLAFANTGNITHRNIDSVIYRWDGTAFAHMQAILTVGAYAWEHFTINGTPHLAVANSVATNSVVYRWNGTKFSHLQNFTTTLVRDWAAFEVDGTLHLAAANFYDSVIYRWDGARFIHLQDIATIGAFDWEHFEIDGTAHLAVANWNGGGSANSVIYRWNGTAFARMQDIPTDEAVGWEYFSIDGVPHLALASTNNTLYRWDETKFAPLQDFSTAPSTSWLYFEVAGVRLLVGASFELSPIYELSIAAQCRQ